MKKLVVFLSVCGILGLFLYPKPSPTATIPTPIPTSIPTIPTVATPDMKTYADIGYPQGKIAPITGAVISFVPMPPFETRIYPSSQYIEGVGNNMFAVYEQYKLRTHEDSISLFMGMGLNLVINHDPLNGSWKTPWGYYYSPVCVRFETQNPPFTLCVEEGGTAFLSP